VRGDCSTFASFTDFGHRVGCLAMVLKVSGLVYSSSDSDAASKTVLPSTDILENSAPLDKVPPQC
jgi:hypothetical protein